jgi:hypothetical protein
LKHKILFFLVLALGAGYVGLSQAAIVKGLYEAEVPVADQGADERLRAMSLALAQVIAKVSGNVDAPQLQGIRDALQSPSQFVQQFRYRRQPPSVTKQPANPAYTELAWFRFDEPAVNRVLRSNGLPVWGRTRPATLAWIAVEQDGARFILGGDNNDNNEDLRQLLEQDAKRNGLALLLPLLDLEDQRSLNFADIWGDFPSAIAAASERYQPDAILVGRLYLSPTDQWQARWSLYENGQGKNWSGNYGQISDAMQAGISGALGVLAKRYAQVFAEDEPGVFRLAVGGVTNLKDFARVSNYLKSLEQVKELYVTRVDPTGATFRLAIRGSSEGLRQTIALGNMLAVAPVTAMNATSGGNMPYPDAPADGPTTAAATEYHYRMLP